MDWYSFWDLATPDQAATALKEMYGAEAKAACCANALQAKNDSRLEDYHFWLVVLCRLYGVSINQTLH